MLSRAMKLKQYARNLYSDSVRQNIEIRLVIGPLIIKQQLKFGNGGTVCTISEFFLFNTSAAIDPFWQKILLIASLFVDIRKRMGAQALDTFNDVVIARY